MSKIRTTLGFIGLGIMGRPMVERLLAADYKINIWNRNPEKSLPLIEQGALICQNPADVTLKSDVILMCLTNGQAVQKVTLGQHGIVEGGRQGKLVVDFSSIDVETTQNIATELSEKCGMNWVDAPVSGGVVGAQKGNLAILCGGAEKHIDEIRPILVHLARRVTHMGGCGAGQVTKLCNQLIVSSNIIAIAEAINLGRRSGIDVEKLPDALTGGFADSMPLQIFGRRMVSQSWTTAMGVVSTMLKDVENVAELAENVGLETHVLRAAQFVYQAVAEKGFADEDLSRVAEFYDNHW